MFDIVYRRPQTQRGLAMQQVPQQMAQPQRRHPAQPPLPACQMALQTQLQLGKQGPTQRQRVRSQLAMVLRRRCQVMPRRPGAARRRTHPPVGRRRGGMVLQVQKCSQWKSMQQRRRLKVYHDAGGVTYP